MMAALQLEAVAKKYDQVVALRDLSLSVEPGEMFGLIGPDGAGLTLHYDMRTADLTWDE